MPTGIEREAGGKPSMRQLFIGPSLIPAAVGLRPSPHATVRGGLELFGDNCATNNQTPPVGSHPYWRRRLLEPRVHDRGERFSRSQHRGDDQQYDRPRFAYHDVDFGTEVVGARNSHSGLGNGGSFRVPEPTLRHWLDWLRPR
jgi:hypothetical protein